MRPRRADTTSPGRVGGSQQNANEGRLGSHPCKRAPLPGTPATSLVTTAQTIEYVWPVSRGVAGCMHAVAKRCRERADGNVPSPPGHVMAPHVMALREPPAAVRNRSWADEVSSSVS